MLLQLVLMMICAADTQAIHDVMQTYKEVKVNWTQKTIIAKGRGIPTQPMQAGILLREQSEKTAYQDAQQKIIDTLIALPINPDLSVNLMLKTCPTIVDHWQTMLESVKAFDTRYFSDSSVDVIIEAHIDALLAELFLNQASVPKTSQQHQQDKHAITGIVINTKGSNIKPSVAPRFIDDQHKVIFDIYNIEPEALKMRGMLAYNKSVDAALKDPRVGDKPVLLRAKSKNNIDLIFSADDVSHIKKYLSLLEHGHIVVIID